MSVQPGVSIIRDVRDLVAMSAPTEWAVAQLQDALSLINVTCETVGDILQAPARNLCIVAAGCDAPAARELLKAADITMPLDPESLALAQGTWKDRPVLLASGRDERGLVYALTELADRVTYSSDTSLSETLEFAEPIVQAPANPIRAVTRMFCTELEDKPWFYDRDFWVRYLDNLMTQRFNRFHLALGIGYDFVTNVLDAYFLFPYPFLLQVPGYDVRVAGLPDEERDRNLETLRFISDECARRGLNFQLGLWMHAYEWIDSPNPNYVIEGVTPDNHAAYCRDALKLLIEKLPGVTGIAFRVHGESGVPEGSYDFWREVFQGVVQSGRRLEVEMHPKGVDPKMIDVALSTGMPVTISPKYTAEHMGLPYQQASIREVERESSRPVKEGEHHRLMNLSGGSLRYTRYGYADFLRADRKFGVFFRIWPGTQRLLLWGDPALASGFGRYSNFCGCLGCDYMEPLSFKGRRGSGVPYPRTGYADSALVPEGGDFEKYLYTYRLFGRLLYDPDTDSDVWRRFLSAEYGAAGISVEAALANASRILPLITQAFNVSAGNNTYWPEIYTNIPITNSGRPHHYRDTPEPKRFGTVSPLDPVLFSNCDEFAEEIVSGNRSGKYSPLQVAQWLHDFADAADEHLARASDAALDDGVDRLGPRYRRMEIDVTLQVGLGRFFAEELRAGTSYSLYLRTNEVARLHEALGHYRSARNHFVQVAGRARDVYVRDITIGEHPQLRGHWLDRIPAIEADLADMEAEFARVGAGMPGGGHSAAPAGFRPTSRLVDVVPRMSYDHAQPPAFRRGEALPITLGVTPVDDVKRPIAVELHYRHVNQAELYEVAAMVAAGDRHSAVIPSGYTDSPYELEYFFVVRDGSGRAWIYPGFTAELSNQPYYVVRQLV